MKNVARLALFFTVSFAAVFVFTVLVRFLHLRIELIRQLPPREGPIGEELSAAIRWALPVSLYVSLLFSLSYTVRRRIFAPAAMVCLFILGSAFSLALMTGVEGFSRLVNYTAAPPSLGNPGLILTQADNAIVLIRDPSDPWSPRVVSIPGQPLLYQMRPQGPGNRPISLPPISFRAGGAWVLQSLGIDFSLAGAQLFDRFVRSGAGFLPFMVYTCSLVFLLVSLRFILGLSNWPLANLFLGALVFRGILTMETFLNSREIQEILEGFVGDLIPPLYTIPLVLVFFGFLISLYTFLSYLARRKDPYEN
ncbi:MAG: hypothetical protein LBQ46_11500 [Treponema sp.]|jgi:hypothetical protein|nr:hypothetical protein [Treponema sp.]